MKQYLSLFFCVFLFVFSFAQQKSATLPDTLKKAAAIIPATKEQETQTEPSIRFGLRVTPSYNWYKVVSKTMSPAAGALKFGGGLFIERRMTKTVSLQTGVGIELCGGSISYKNDPSGEVGTYTTRYFYSKVDEDIVKYNSEHRNDPSYQEYLLLERKYKNTYLSIPLNLKMKTAEVSGLRFFGQIGPEFQFRWNAHADDRVQSITTNMLQTNLQLGPEEELTKLNIKQDIGFFNLLINMGIGAEYNLGGTTSLFVGLNYYLGIFNPVDNDSYFISRVYQSTPTAFEENKLKQDLRANLVGLTIGVLF